MSKICCVLFLLALATPVFCQQEVLVFGENADRRKEKVVFGGRVLDASNGKPLPGAVLYLEQLEQSDVTTGDGNFKLTMPPGIYSLTITFLGYDDLTVNLQIFDDASHDFSLVPGTIGLREVTVSDTRSDHNITSVIGGVEQLSIEKLNRQAKFLGEMDVLRSLQAVAGVTSAGEGAAGFNVRGGNTDENLILMDGNLIFNPVHALGFFSLFHPDLVQGVTLYKGGLPSKYGGRLSSVLDVKLREGNAKQLSLLGGVGLGASRLVMEGPIVRDKASFIVGARAGYFDWILKQARNVDLQKSQAAFYDLTAKADARLSETTKVGFTAFNTSDGFRFADEVKFEYATSSTSAYLRQLVGKKINLLATANAGQYVSNLFDIFGNNQSRFTNKIKYLRGGVSGFFQPVEALQLELGIEQNRYTVSPGALRPSEVSNVKADALPDEHAHETSFFMQNQWAVSKRIELMTGIRYTRYRNLGPAQVLRYEEGVPKTAETSTDTLQFAKNEKTAEYAGLEPRLSLRVSLGTASSVKLGYNRFYQFLSQVSNTASATPIDIWQLANYHIGPQHADNVSIGYYQNFRENTVQTSFELFYRKFHQIIDYKDFARLLLNHHIETELVTGQGKAYGAELYFNKAYGPHRFEFNYTFSRTLRRVEATPEQEPISGGGWYPSNFDKPHSLNLNYFFQIKTKGSLSVNFTYSTGRPTTAPVSSFSTSNVLTIPIYSERNQYRIPDYHRMDLAYSTGPWGKKDRWRNSLTFSIYNLYFRKNAFSVFFRQNPFQQVKAYRVAVLGTMFPAVTYDFTF